MQAVADKLIDARYQLLDELFNRFAGPIDLASSIQIVNNIRKIPYLSATQLRIAILQYRDVYLEKQLLDIRVSSGMSVKILSFGQRVFFLFFSFPRIIRNVIWKVPILVSTGFYTTNGRGLS